MARKMTSAGFVIASRNPTTKELMYLLCHASGGGQTKGWGIPKGKRDGKEPLLQTALREVQEETGFDIYRFRVCNPIDIHHDLYYTYTLKDKIVYVYTLIDNEGLIYKEETFYCPSKYESGEPEIDDYKWCTIDEAIEIATKSQKGLFEHIKEQGL